MAHLYKDRAYKRTMPTPSSIIYVKRACPFCVKLQKLLDARTIQYTLVDVQKEDASEAVHREGRVPVPQVEYDGRIIFDYTTEEALVAEIVRMMKS